MPEVKVTLKRSLIGVRQKQKEAVRCLGLRKINKSRVFKDTPALRGQIQVVNHLVSIEEGRFTKKEVPQQKKKDKVLKKSVSEKTKGNK